MNSSEVVNRAVQAPRGKCDAGPTTASCQISDDFADVNRDHETKKPVFLSETARK